MSGNSVNRARNGVSAVKTGHWRTLWGRGRAWSAPALDLLFPPHCLLCHREGEQGHASAPLGDPFCGGCASALADSGTRCLRCGRIAAGSACRACRGRRRDWDGIVVLGGYGGVLRQAVLAAKRPRGDDLAAALAALLHRHHAGTISSWRADVVVPVPMHWWRRVVRGTSSADVIADRLGRLAGVPVRRWLRRTRATVMQNRLPPEARRGNVRDAFSVRRGDVDGKRVLLVDDVVTTGGTLSDCRRALTQAGAASVHVAVLARADHRGDADGDGGTD